MCRKTGVTHFLTTISGNRIVVDLQTETAATLKHILALIDLLRNECKGATDIEIIKTKIRKSYPNCKFPNELPDISTAHNIL